jgi:CheY-like chemotaxis protein
MGRALNRHSDTPNSGCKQTLPTDRGPDTEGPTSDGTTSGRTILVVDDNADITISLKLLLESFGHRVYCAYEGRAALRAARKYAPDIVVLDIGLPLLNGFEVARRLRSDSPRGKPLLIAATGYVDAQDHGHSLREDFDFHLVKPIDIAKLQEIIAAHGGD